ncbi:hypothetical protein [Paenibacillus odorifer]|uniref:hypothetical protein n=1 Tax=Paenibacillus odorifer TaxID=189426 RepID=UPI00096DD265|nr:hypothetical protein [Paenibacillus odorifer]OMD67605.1 hypothetical protein BSK50_30000 [Paenibacillus odorifer]
MSWTLDDNNIESIIEQILHELNIEASIESDYEHSPMAYNYRTNTFKFSKDLIEKDLTCNGLISLVYVKLLTYHEVGHYLDFKKNLNSVLMLDKLVEIDVQIALEENAWDLGRTVVPEDMREEFDEINRDNLRRLEFNKYNPI